MNEQKADLDAVQLAGCAGSGREGHHMKAIIAAGLMAGMALLGAGTAQAVTSPYDMVWGDTPSLDHTMATGACSYIKGFANRAPVSVIMDEIYRQDHNWGLSDDYVLHKYTAAASLCPQFSTDIIRWVNNS